MNFRFWILHQIRLHDYWCHSSLMVFITNNSRQRVTLWAKSRELYKSCMFTCLFAFLLTAMQPVQLRIHSELELEGAMRCRETIRPCPMASDFDSLSCGGSEYHASDSVLASLWRVYLGTEWAGVVIHNSKNSFLLSLVFSSSTLADDIVGIVGGGLTHSK